MEPVDPLFLDPNARFYDVGNGVFAEGREALQFSMKNSRTGEEGVVRCRFVYMPPSFQRAGDGGTNERLKNHEGEQRVRLSRAGRQIDLVTRTNYPKEDLNACILSIFDRNWAIELDFDPEVDEEFGITVNKQQVSLSERAWQALMDNGLPSIIKNDLRKPFKKAKDEEKAKDDVNTPKQSEQVMAEAKKFTKKRAPLPDSKREQARKETGCSGGQRGRADGKAKGGDRRRKCWNRRRPSGM